MAAEDDARQDVLDAVDDLRGPACLIPSVRVQRQYEFERLLDVLIGEVADGAYRGGCDDTKDDAFREGKDEGLDEGREEGRNEGDAEGYTRGYDLGKTDGLEEGLRVGKVDGYEEGHRAGFDEAERGRA